MFRRLIILCLSLIGLSTLATFLSKIESKPIVKNSQAMDPHSLEQAKQYQTLILEHSDKDLLIAGGNIW